MTGGSQAFAARVVAWQKAHGRRGLPWQGVRDPYRVWVSEIMLQQTQVATVLEYFPRFLRRFPDVKALATADLDDVLGLWSGLGYYSRARNLHRCAIAVVQEHGGEFPCSALQLQALPGIGRSTAGAIAAFCFGERVAILDGNVKRVLTRILGFDADLAVVANERALWDRATALLPDRAQAMPVYTQGLMDLGAGVCLLRNPTCPTCPLRELCIARRQGRPEYFPVKTRKVKRSAESLWLLQAQTAQGAFWLAKRPTPGIWAGLYCLPVFESREALQAKLPARFQARLRDEPSFTHVLTHKDLHLHPVAAQLPASALAGVEGAWVAADRWAVLGLPVPIRTLLSRA